MTQFHPVLPTEAQGELLELYKGLEQKMGKVFNIFLHMGNSKEALKAFLALNEAANKSSLSPKLRELISLLIAELNGCDYCLCAHTAIAKAHKIEETEILSARKGGCKDPQEEKILHFVRTMVLQRGKIAPQELADLKASGVSDKQIVEIILVVTENIFTNYINLVTATPIDFPKTPALKT